MDVQSALILSLVEFYPEDSIRSLWKQAAEALTSRSTSAITINATTFDGQTSSGIALSDPNEIANFISACSAAIKKIRGDTSVDPSDLGTPVSFASRVLQV